MSYRKVDTRIHNDAKYRKLSDLGKLSFLTLLTHPHMTALGAMRGSVPGIAVENGWGVEAYREAFNEALSVGMVEYDESAPLIWLPNFIKYNPPESPNVVKAWARSLDLLPECALLTRVVATSVAFAKTMNKAFAEALPEAFAKTMPIHEPEPEHKQDKSTCTPTEAGHKRTQARNKRSSTKAYSAEFEEAWSEYPARSGGNSKSAAYAAWNARIGEGHSPTEMIAGVARYRAFCEATGRTGTEFVKQASTFLGPNDPPFFSDAWSGQANKSQVQALRSMLPRRDEELEGWARQHNYPKPAPGESYQQYRSRLQREAKKRLHEEKDVA